ncbi:MAG: DUF3127 domain-containing protein [Bacteroidales bacterium]|nr:DUF3127 domain-containing protein [Bacteroidales bacterium]
MSFELTGKLIEKFEIQQITASFQKREFVVEKIENASGREFTETIKFQLTQDRCDLIEKFEINTEIKISFNIKGRKWEKNGNVSYFTNLEAWRIENAEQGMNAAPPPQTEADIPPPPEEEDLPF